MTPREDPKDKAARLRERRLSEIELGRASQQTAADLTTDLRGAYGMRSGSLFRLADAKRVGSTTKASTGTTFGSR